MCLKAHFSQNWQNSAELFKSWVDECIFLILVDWEIEVIESRETAYNQVVIMPYGAGKGRKSARNFKLEALHPVPFISEALRWLIAIFEAFR